MVMNMSEVSVIVPVYNVESYIRRCVDSILMQTYKDFELILVDDGSPDSCGSICDEYARKDKRIIVIHQKNKGLSAARNSGIEWAMSNSKSKWLTFVDSDDWIHPQYLELLLEAAKSTDSKISVCSYVETNKEIFFEYKNKYEVNLWDVEQFYVENNVNATVAWGKLYKKECFNQIRYPVNKIHEDEFVTYQILFSVPYVTVIDSPLYAYYINGAGIMHSSWSEKRLVVLDAYKEQIEYFKKHHFNKAYLDRIETYIWKIFDYGDKCDRILNNKKLVSHLRKKMREVLFLYVKDAGLAIKKYPWAYEFAYPNLMKIYWLIF